MKTTPSPTNNGPKYPQAGKLTIIQTAAIASVISTVVGCSQIQQQQQLLGAPPSSPPVIIIKGK